MSVQRYDITTDSYVEVTQEAWDDMERAFMLFRSRFIVWAGIDEQSIAGRDKLDSEQYNFRIAMFPNPMRAEKVFIAQDLPIEPYVGVFNRNGQALRPVIPQKGFALGFDIPLALGIELVTRWNLYQEKVYPSHA